MFKNNINNESCTLSLQNNGNAAVARSTSKAESENKNDGIAPPKPKVMYFRKFAFLHEKKSAIRYHCPLLVSIFTTDLCYIVGDLL